MTNLIIQPVIFQILFNQSCQSMHSRIYHPQSERKNQNQQRKTVRKPNSSLRKRKNTAIQFITPIKKPTIYNENSSTINPETVKKHYSGQQFCPYEDKFFRIYGFDSVKINRARIIDWFIQICRVFNQSWNTFWMTVDLMDKLIAEVGFIKVQNIHLAGSVLIFISSKYVQHQPIKLETIQRDILYKKFTKNDILTYQEVILSHLLFDQKNSSLHFPSIWDKVLQICHQQTQTFIKLVFRELVYVFMAPHIALFDTTKRIREKHLVKAVTESISKGQRFQKAEQVESYFLQKYGCMNARKLAQKISI